MVYNLTGISSNATGIVPFVQGVNEILVFGWLGTLFLIGVSVIIFMSFMFATANNVKTSMSATSYIAFTLSILLTALDLMPVLVLYITLAVCAAAIAFSFKLE